VEPNQINILPLTVLRDLEQIDETQETGFSRQLWSDVRKTNRLDGIHFDLAFVHPVPGSHFHVRANPDSDAAGDFSATNSIAKTLSEYHSESLRRALDCNFDRFVCHNPTSPARGPLSGGASRSCSNATACSTRRQNRIVKQPGVSKPHTRRNGEMAFRLPEGLSRVWAELRHGLARSTRRAICSAALSANAINMKVGLLPPPEGNVDVLTTYRLSIR
jgi:hypothetical protein